MSSVPVCATLAIACVPWYAACMTAPARWCTPEPGEDDTSYRAFRLYRDLPAREREIEELAYIDHLIDLDEAYAWADQFDWYARALEFDVYRDRRRQARIDELADARLSLSDREGAMGLSMLRAAEKAAENLVHNAQNLRARDVIALAAAAHELLAQGVEPTDPDHELGDRLAAALEPEELAQLYALFEKADV